MTTLLTIGVLLLLSIWLLLRWKSRQSAATRDPVASAFKPYSAVAVRGPASACDAAKRVAEERFLTSKSPELPLIDCDRKATCECYFTQYDDRRRTHDRRSPYTLSSGTVGTGIFTEERRQGKERRENSTSGS